MKKKLTSFLFIALLGAGMCAQAQNLRINRGEMNQRRAEALIKEMKLDEATKTWFMPLFKEYSDTLRNLNRKYRQPKLGKENAEISEMEAARTIENSFKKAEAEVALKRAYYARFKEKLTDVQLLKVFTGDNNFRQNFGNSRQRMGGPRQLPGGFAPQRDNAPAMDGPFDAGF